MEFKVDTAANIHILVLVPITNVSPKLQFNMHGLMPISRGEPLILV